MKQLLEFIQGLSERAKAIFDTVSIGTVLATLGEVLPALAALVSILWGCIRIYETRTVQGWLGRKAP